MEIVGTNPRRPWAIGLISGITSTLWGVCAILDNQIDQLPAYMFLMYSTLIWGSCSTALGLFQIYAAWSGYKYMQWAAAVLSVGFYAAMTYGIRESHAESPTWTFAFGYMLANAVNGYRLLRKVHDGR